MRFTMPAFWTQASADSATRKGTAHAASPLSALTSPASASLALSASLTLSTALPHSAASSSVHQVFLLVHAAHCPAMASTTPTTARHRKGVTLQVAVEPSLDDFAQFARHEREHLDTVRCDQLTQRPGNRAANQHADAQIRQTKRLLDRQVVSERLLSFADDPFRLGLDNVKMPCRVKDRRDPIVPGCKCCLHSSGSAFASPLQEAALLVPRRFEKQIEAPSRWK
jgi:hypothetical protein